MRNKYKGPCYRCSLIVEVGKGHFERYHGKWRVIHAECVFQQRAEKDREAQNGREMSTQQTSKA